MRTEIEVKVTLRSVVTEQMRLRHGLDRSTSSDALREAWRLATLPPEQWPDALPFPTTNRHQPNPNP
ncbi:MAG: hypothetical protein AAB460_02200 [Patescibacteria group bacterium]